jgi:hypothetical protein
MWLVYHFTVPTVMNWAAAISALLSSAASRRKILSSLWFNTSGVSLFLVKDLEASRSTRLRQNAPRNATSADRAQLRPVFDAILDAVLEFGEVAIQARKTYVSLVSPRRTFARVQPTTKARLDLGLRLDGQQPGAPPLGTTVTSLGAVLLAVAVLILVYGLITVK